MHVLSDMQEQTRAYMSGELLQPLQVQKAKALHKIVTIDESEFYLSNDHELIWLPAGAPVLDRKKYIIQSSKLILTVIWNPHGFHLVDALQKGMKFNGSYYVTRILKLFHEGKKQQAFEATRKLIIYADNARSHGKIGGKFLGD
jgi:hypothetical protein